MVLLLMMVSVSATAATRSHFDLVTCYGSNRRGSHDKYCFCNILRCVLVTFDRRSRVGCMGRTERMGGFDRLAYRCYILVT